MNKFIRLGLPLLVLAVLSVASLSSCGHRLKEKTYKNVSDYSQTMEFLGDSTVLIKGVHSQPKSGIYRVSGNLLIVNFTTPSQHGGQTSVEWIFRILDKGKTLIRENDAARWARV